MVLTIDVLEKNGFLTNHPDYVVKKYYCASDKNDPCEWRIMAEQEYINGTNILVINVNMWRCAKSGAIIKRVSCSDVQSIEELNNLIKICGINKVIDNI